MTIAHATPQQLINAVEVLVSADHFDETRRLARQLPNVPIVDLLRAADGATRLAHELDIQRRISS